MPIVFDGIHEKLKRANENIVNLNSEIARFFQEGKYPVLPNDDDEALLEAISYHKNRAIPLRFSVLVGEVIHHLRSCLDHVVWQFSSEQYRRDRFRKIEFPVFEKEPLDKDSISRYEGKVKGITNHRVLDFIKGLQPYNAPDPLDAPIMIVHNMDIFDKHRELVLCSSTGTILLPTKLLRDLIPYAKQKRDTLPPEIEAEMHSNLKVVPQISFLNFGRREIQPVIPGLQQLTNIFTEIVARFEREI